MGPKGPDPMYVSPFFKEAKKVEEEEEKGESARARRRREFEDRWKRNRYEVRVRG
jgi:hypothetical protein